jgi:hypothetical protein
MMVAIVSQVKGFVKFKFYHLIKALTAQYLGELCHLALMAVTLTISASLTSFILKHSLCAKRSSLGIRMKNVTY